LNLINPKIHKRKIISEKISKKYKFLIKIK
jgi:hypothetical protein